MKILFLGTSTGWPLPRLGCNCPLCQSTDPKDKRLRPAVLVNETILIDAPPDIYHELTHLKVDTTKIKTLLLTHSHPDHIHGFYDLTHLYNRQEKELKLVVPLEVLNGLRQFHSLPLKPFKPEIIQPKTAIKEEGIKIAYFPVIHSHLPCYGIKMKKEKIFVYLPDLKKLPKPEKKAVKDVHLLVMDGSSLGKKGQTRIHQSIEEGLELAQELKPKLCYFTHIGHITGTHQELEAFVQKHGGKNCHIAYDGLELEI
jgi:phosphoribosyl 1,2-cyclic phosphate phosphodiesterase